MISVNKPVLRMISVNKPGLQRCQRPRHCGSRRWQSSTNVWIDPEWNGMCGSTLSGKERSLISFSMPYHTSCNLNYNSIWKIIGDTEMNECE